MRAGAVGMVAFALLFWGGLFHWLWLPYDIGSWLMVLAAVFPPTLIVACGVGVWSLVFDVPAWVVNMFA